MLIDTSVEVSRTPNVVSLPSLAPEYVNVMHRRSPTSVPTKSGAAL